jgi:sulfur carrier protein
VDNEISTARHESEQQAMINIIVNGKRDTVEQRTSLGDFLVFKKIDPAVAVVEINRSIVKKEDFDKTVLNSGDAVEVLRFVGGG